MSSTEDAELVLKYVPLVVFFIGILFIFITTHANSCWKVNSILCKVGIFFFPFEKAYELHDDPDLTTLPAKDNPPKDAIDNDISHEMQSIEQASKKSQDTPIEELDTLQVKSSAQVNKDEILIFPGLDMCVFSGAEKKLIIRYFAYYGVAFVCLFIFLFTKLVLIETQISHVCLSDFSCVVAHFDNRPCEAFLNTTRNGTIARILCYRFHDLETIIFTNLPIFFAVFQLIGGLNTIVFTNSFKVGMVLRKCKCTNLLYVIIGVNLASYIAWFVLQVEEALWLSSNIAYIDQSLFKILAVLLSSMGVFNVAVGCAFNAKFNYGFSHRTLFYRKKKQS